MKEKTDKETRKGNNGHHQGLPRVKREVAAQYAAQVEKALTRIAKVNVAGSFRRECATVGDLDFVVIPKKGIEVEKIWEVARKKLGEPTIGGNVKILPRKGTKKVDKKAQYILNEEIVVDIYILEDEKFIGSFILYLTGSATENKIMRWTAQERGMTLSQWGLKIRETGELVGEQTEKAIYKNLGMTYKTPKERR